MARDNGTASTERAGTAPEPVFRDLLAAVIDHSSLTQEEIGREVGRSGAAVSQWLNKGDMPDLAIAFKLEAALDLRLGFLVRHHSPDVWGIIETKVTGGNGWHALSPEKKFEEAVLEMRITDRQRDLLREAADNYLELNALRAGGPGPDD